MFALEQQSVMTDGEARRKRRPVVKSFAELFLQGLKQPDAISFAREYGTSLSFPQKLMLMIRHAELVREISPENNSAAPSIEWVANGTVFAIRNKSELFQGLVPLFFGDKGNFTKVARSFTRKLARWRICNVSIPPGESFAGGAMYYGHEFFLRDFPEFVGRMRCFKMEQKAHKRKPRSTAPRVDNDCDSLSSASARRKRFRSMKKEAKTAISVPIGRVSADGEKSVVDWYFASKEHGGGSVVGVGNGQDSGSSSICHSKQTERHSVASTLTYDEWSSQSSVVG